MISLKRIFFGLTAVFALFASGGPLLIQAADTKPTSPIGVPAPVPAVVTAPAPTVLPFETFRTIAEHNIFDPNRVGRSRTVRTEAARPTDDVISLVGTMDSGDGILAFFDSPLPKFKKVVHVGETLADYTVTKITPQAVELTRAGKALSLQVAQQLRRPVGEDWTVAATEPTRADARAAPSPDAAASGTDNSSPSPSAPADASDLVKRLMERRQNQLKE
jgi:hypothetical protein